MNIRDATSAYERWLGEHTSVVRADLTAKHVRMAESPFEFLRGTFYRWMQFWPTVSASVADAPRVLAVCDLHVENFGTWRAAEGRLVWGVNDVDGACELPQNLERLADEWPCEPFATVILAQRHEGRGRLSRVNRSWNRSGRWLISLTPSCRPSFRSWRSAFISGPAVAL